MYLHGHPTGTVVFGLQERTGYTPPAKDKEAINRLKIVYGAMPPNLTPDYKRTEKSIGLLKVRAGKTERVNCHMRDLRSQGLRFCCWCFFFQTCMSTDVHRLFIFFIRRARMTPACPAETGGLFIGHHVWETPFLCEDLSLLAIKVQSNKTATNCPAVLVPACDSLSHTSMPYSPSFENHPTLIFLTSWPSATNQDEFPQTLLPP